MGLAGLTKGLSRAEPFVLLFAVVGAVLITFIALPLVATVVYEGPGDLVTALEDPEVRSAITVSFGAALLATALSLVFGIPLAYIMARKQFPGKGVLQGIIDVPIVVPHTVAGIALLVVFGRMGMFSDEMSALDLKFEDHLLGIIAAMMFVSASFVVNAVREGFEAVDPRLEHVARSLGASGSQAFMTVTLPLSGSAVLTGAVMAWARAVSEFGAVYIIASFPKIAPTLMYERNLHSGLSESMPVAALLVVLCVGIFVTFRTVSVYLKKRSEET